jgi:signal transduction histidine kinase
VLAFVAVAVLAAVLIGVITLSLIRLLPERGLEQQLADQAQAVSDTGAAPLPARQLCVLARVLRRGETEVYLLSADAVPRRLPRCQAPNRRGPIAPVPDVDLAAALARRQVVTGTGDGLAWAVAPASRPAPGARGGVLLVHETRRLGLSLLPVVAWRLLLATALAVAVAALAAWLLAGRLTAPLGRLVAAARRVGEGDLSTRVQVDGDGEVAEVAAAFNDMAAGLERAQGEQRAFLASVGHELKTPLTTVQGYTEALLDGTVDDPAERRRSLLRVHAETIRLARLVQDLLDLARLGRGQFAVSSVDADVGAVLREAAAAAVLAAARAQLAERGVEVSQVQHYEGATLIDGDLKEVLAASQPAGPLQLDRRTGDARQLPGEPVHRISRLAHGLHRRAAHARAIATRSARSGWVASITCTHLGSRGSSSAVVENLRNREAAATGSPVASSDIQSASAS